MAKFFGETVYDFEPHISYRQHGDNAIGAYRKRGLAVYWRNLKFMFDREQQFRYRNAISFLDCYGDLLDKKDYEKVAEVANYKNSISDRIRLLFDREIRAESITGDLKARIMIVLGTV